MLHINPLHLSPLKATMLILELKRIVLILGPLLVVLIITASLWSNSRMSTPGPASSYVTSVADYLISGWGSPSSGSSDSSSSSFSSSSRDGSGDSINQTHQLIRSISTPTGRYFPIRFDNLTAFNPSIIPHPTLNNTYIIVAQRRRVNPDGSEPSDTSIFNVEIGCNAQFLAFSSFSGSSSSSPSFSPFVQGYGKPELRCATPPEVLPIAATLSGHNKCPPELGFMTWNVGPHDARVFWGPKRPFIIFGSNSKYACFGLFLQDFGCWLIGGL